MSRCNKSTVRHGAAMETDVLRVVRPRVLFATLLTEDLLCLLVHFLPSALEASAVSLQHACTLDVSLCWSRNLSGES